MDPRRPEDALGLLLAARSGRLTRRQILSHGLRLGLSTSAILALLSACQRTEGGATPTVPPAATPQGAQTPTGRRESPNRELVVLFFGGVPDLDPQSAYDNQASALFLACYEMLLKLKGESTFEYEPMLAREWSHNADFTEFTFVLPPNAVFHDGSPCDANAVKRSFTRFLKMGRGPVNVISRFVEDPDEQIQVVDTTTIKFVMTKPQPLFLAAMASEYGPLVVSPKAWDEHKTASDEFAHDWFSQNVVGTGPYKAVELLQQERFVFERFDQYHGDRPFFDRIVARVVPEDATRRQLIETGEAHACAYINPEDLLALKQNPNVQVVEYDTTEVDWIRMNYALLNTKARQGFCYAWPYQEVIEKVLRGFARPINGPIADTVIGYDASIPTYTTDLQRAKQLLTEAGVKEGDSFTYMYSSGDQTEAAMAQLFQANLAQIGIRLEIQQVERAALLELAYGDTPPEQRPHFISGGWWPDYNDSWNQIYPNYHSDSVGSKGSNAMYYRNPEVDRLMDQLKDAATEDEIRRLTGQIVRILTWDDPAAIFYAQIRKATVLQKDIRGFVPNPIYINSYNFWAMWREAL
ncbi:MAG: ABC transporter substrate-binding protein [Thermomicrobium sp.]|nr:ABC transporter substrate-binding protein [Thermomicrobium sp.]